MEIALDEIPIYAGGLGVLEGDKFYTASRLNIEYYVMTMFHRNGYVDYDYKDGVFIERSQEDVIRKAESLLEREKELVVSSKVYGEILVAPLVFKKGSARVIYFKPEYPEHISRIASRLYVEETPEQAIAKYIVFARSSAQYMRERIGFERIKYIDLQESIASLAALELKDLKGVVRLVIHTPGPWGHPMIPDEVLEREYGVDTSPGLVRITDVVLREVPVGFGVSRKHWEMLHRIFPQFVDRIAYVRNGVDLERWVHSAIKSLVSSKGLGKISPEDLAPARRKAREDLISLIRSRKPDIRVEGPIIAWARRLTKYKRPYLIERLIRDLGREVNATFILAGKAHPKDHEGREYMARFRKLHEQFDNVVYIHDYSLDIARAILSGSDLLLFTPFSGWEACGTSYMKAGANGIPTLSSRDGGALETIIDGFNGWFFGLELVDFINIYENTARVSAVDEEDYRDLRTKFLKILELIDKDPEAYLEISINALKSFTISSNSVRMFREYRYLS
ncbi:glucan phosphorylase [Desulfurococcaceae archaeon AG1]|jgi:starch phosphorylase|nr:MAG: hypothetical protein DJ555_06250 [Desulfurococcaceae archaeon]GAY25581.1 glucan phosphorylase [Desulfurococcaceae archaeon AG1]